MRISIALLTTFALCNVASLALAQAPASLGFQGLLTRTDGTPLDSSGVSMTFRLYKDGTPVWSETQVVDVENGTYNVSLGAVVPLDTLAFDQPIDLGIKLDGEPSEMSPRTPLVATAYARGLLGFHTYFRRDASPHISYNVIGGHEWNVVSPDVTGATISGGGGFVFGTLQRNRVIDDFGTVGGGAGNRAGFRSTVGGGYVNLAYGANNTIGGGFVNVTQQQSTTIGGGSGNNADRSWATVAGGQSNEAQGAASAICGGTFNIAGGEIATICGGDHNVASGYGSAVLGGFQNRAAGTNSLAVGYHAKAAHDGTFVWNDRSVTTGDDSLISTGANQFLVRASGGVGVNTNLPGGAVHVTSDSGSRPNMLLEQTATADYARVRLKNDDNSEYWGIEAGSTDNEVLNIYTSQGGRGAIMSFRATGDPLVMYNSARLTHSGIWKNASSSKLKTDYKEIDPYEILQKLSALPLTQWRYKVEPESVRHIGPVAEDFSDAFGLGQDDTTIGTVDADGVALAAIQGLYELVKKQQAEIERMREVIETLNEKR